MFSDSKGKMLKRLQEFCSIKKEDTIAIGDGANDISMFKCAGKSAAFCAKPAVKEHADIIIDKNDLTELLNYIF